MIETINKLIRTSRHGARDRPRAHPEELAKRLAMPLEKVRKVMKIAKEPITPRTPIGDEETPTRRLHRGQERVLPSTRPSSRTCGDHDAGAGHLTPREERVCGCGSGSA